MNNLLEISQASDRRWKGYMKRNDKIQEEISKLEKKRKRLDCHIGIRDLFKPFAEKIKKKLKADGYSGYGPFGLCSEMTIYFLKNKEKSITIRGNVLGSITFINSFDIRTTKIKNRYPKGTIAEMNGMNYETIPASKKMNLRWFIDHARRGR